MSAVSLINPYAPQPAPGAAAEGGIAPAAPQPVSDARAGREAGSSSDQSGSGAGNGTATGGAFLDTLLRRGRGENAPSDATPESVVKAQSRTGSTSDYLDRLTTRAEQVRAEEAARSADSARTKAEIAKEKADEAAEPAYEMPNPLPTAPILVRDEP